MFSVVLDRIYVQSTRAASKFPDLWMKKPRIFYFSNTISPYALITKF